MGSGPSEGGTGMAEAIDEPEIEGRPGLRAEPDRSGQPLRIGLLAATVQPRWRLKVIDDVLASADCQLVLVLLARPSTRPGSSGRDGRRRGWLGRLYAAIDRRLFRKGPDALDEVEIVDHFRDRSLVEIRPAAGDGSIGADDAARIVVHDLDVLLCLGVEPSGDRVAGLARFGAWAYRFGEAGPAFAEPIGLLEVLGGRPSTPVSLNQICAGPDGEERVLYSATLKTDRLSCRRHGDHVGAVASSFVGRMLGRLRLKAGLDPSLEMVTSKVRAQPVPGDPELVLLMLRFAGRLAAEGLRRAFYRDEWALAYSHLGRWNGHRPDLASLRLLVPPGDRFWADPFPIEVGGKTYIFFEDYSYPTGKGHISVFEVDELGEPGNSRIALERPYHLSYPFVFSWAGQLYMIPETTSVGDVELFRCMGLPDRWEFDRTLLKGVRAADASIEEHDGHWWLFATIQAPGAHNDVEELHLFHAESPLGPWTSHRRNPIKSDVGSSRPAGRLYQHDGTWYRPAQDCTLGYGHSIVLNRVEVWDVEDYREVQAGRIDPDWAPGLDRTHTFNALGPLFVMDARIARRRFLPAARG